MSNHSSCPLYVASCANTASYGTPSPQHSTVSEALLQPAGGEAESEVGGSAADDAQSAAGSLGGSAVSVGAGSDAGSGVAGSISKTASRTATVRSEATRSSAHASSVHASSARSAAASQSSAKAPTAPASTIKTHTPLSVPLSSIASAAEVKELLSTKQGPPSRHSASRRDEPGPSLSAVEGQIVLAAFQQLQDRIAELQAKCEAKDVEIAELRESCTREAARQDQAQSLSAALGSTMEQQSRMLEERDRVIAELRGQVEREECNTCVGSADVIAQLTTAVAEREEDNERMRQELTTAREALLSNGEKYRVVSQKLEVAERSLEAIYRTCSNHNFPVPLPGYNPPPAATPYPSPSGRTASASAAPRRPLPTHTHAQGVHQPTSMEEYYEASPRRTYRLPSGSRT